MLRIALIYNGHISCGVGTFFKRAFEKTPHVIQHFWLKDAAQIPHTFDLYVRIDEGDYSTTDIPSYLKPSIYYAVDTHIPRSRASMEKFIAHYDVIFCAQYLGVPEWQKKYKQVIWMPLGYDPQVHKPSSQPIHQKYDIGFVGSLGGGGGAGGMDRKFILQELGERYPNTFMGKFPYLDIADIYTQSKIGFNFSIQNDINMRIFEILACGALLLTNRIQDPMLEQLFKDREHLVIYENLKDLHEKIDFYLSHDDERNQIASQGHQRVLVRPNRYLDRVHRMLELIENPAHLSLI